MSVKERPILFSGPMVRAILERRKTMTRRVVDPQPKVELFPFLGQDNKPTGEFAFVDHPRVISKHIRCPHGVPGDRLWVRETWVTCKEWDALPPREIDAMWVRQTETFPIWRLADGPNVASKSGVDGKVRPGIFLPRRFSRLTLELTEVRVERLQDITEADAIAEGCEACDITDADIREALNNPMDEGAAYMVAFGPGTITAKCDFIQLWDSINGKKHPWESNPWIWVESFRKVN